MRDGEILIYAGSALEKIGMVRLTKMLINDNEWLKSEYWRINRDSDRVAAIGFCGNEQFALYVNDVTGGMFDLLGEEE